MTKSCIIEKSVSHSTERVKEYWRVFRDKCFLHDNIQMLRNGYFMISTPFWRTTDVYNNQAKLFIARLETALVPNLTFHVFGNGYMAVAKNNGFLEIYAPDGSSFDTQRQRVMWFGKLSAYVFVEKELYYLADIVNPRNYVLLGCKNDICYVEQNINGLVVVSRRDTVELYNEEMELITPVEGAVQITCFDSGSFIVKARGDNSSYTDYLFNAEMECLLKSSVSMEFVDSDCFSICQRLYNSSDGSVINTEGRPFSSLEGKPFYTSIGKLFARGHKLVKENGEVVLGFFPNTWDLSIFADHFAGVLIEDRYLVFDLALSVQDTKQAICEVLSEYPNDKDVSSAVFNYFRQLILCLEGTSTPNKKMLNGLLLS